MPEGWRSEVIPFPLDFAPELRHAGTEELRFAPGFFDPAAPGYWTYAFVWRLADRPAWDAATVATELTAYFRGLTNAVDEKREIADRDAIVAQAENRGDRLALAVHTYDAFKTKQPIDLVGTATMTPCGAGALWTFTLEPKRPAPGPLHDALVTLAASARCDQPVERTPKR